MIIISPIVKLYLKIKHIRFDVADYIEHQVSDNENTMIFCGCIWDIGSSIPNASATIPGVVLLNMQWVKQIIMHQDMEDMHLAFRETIGHELCHQQNDFILFKPFTKEGKFARWVNEVHADFGSISRIFSGEREPAFRAMQYKKKNKKVDKDTYTHPSWKRRICYIRNYDFTEELIRKIADDVGCNNIRLIKDVCSHFEEIHLSNGISCFSDK